MNELQIRVPKTELLKRLTKHKQRFTTSYEALLKAFKKKSEQYQKNFKNYVEWVSKPHRKGKEPKRPYQPERPTDRTKDYDFYIKMVEQHDDHYLYLPETVYRRLWLDEWSWVAGHIALMASYADDADVAEVSKLYE